jgi:hypothetical protein
MKERKQMVLDYAAIYLRIAAGHSNQGDTQMAIELESKLQMGKVDILKEALDVILQDPNLQG